MGEWLREPFPHAVIEDFWGPDAVRLIADEFPDLSDRRWTHYSNGQEEKYEGSNPGMWGPRTQLLAAHLSEPLHLAWLSNLTGIPDLIPKFTGGGYHLIPPGGYLGKHVDFNREGELYRRLNFLVFLNPEWDRNWGGELLLSRDPEFHKRIVPYGGRAVVFETSERSYHGHPTPLASPPGVFRKSFACYYFTKEAPEGVAEPHSTIFE